uniref:Uncharacterized protein n=1 Tax=Oryza meridionalis TaxID=40149 RepID=A0A0E0CW47_9ORYZ
MTAAAARGEGGGERGGRIPLNQFFVKLGRPSRGKLEMAMGGVSDGIVSIQASMLHDRACVLSTMLIG